MAIVLALLAVLLVTAGATPSAAAPKSQTIRVTGDTAAAENDSGGWLFNRDDRTSSPYEMSFDQASIGVGSAYVMPIGTNPADKFIAELFLVAPMSSIDSISYDIRLGEGHDAHDANQFYANVYANFPGTSGTAYGDCVYNVIPNTVSDDEWTTVTFDPAQSYDVRSRTSAECPSTPLDLGDGATLRMLALNLGDTNDDDAGLDGYFDNVVVTTEDGTTTYDFEPVVTKDDCKKGGYADFGFDNQGQCVSYVNAG